MLRPIRRALFSVSDKTGLAEFATELATKYGVELIATGGTMKVLADAGLPVKDVRELTGFPEILDGRVKTLHPAIYAGLLAKRDKPEHMATLAEHNLPEIDLVVCNLYPFEQTVARPGVTEAEAIENIDIGGPCMIRAAAKNFESVAVLTNPLQYARSLTDLEANQGSTTLHLRTGLALSAFGRVARYDMAIQTYLEQTNGLAVNEFPYTLYAAFNARQGLRYGENSHQQAAFYIEPDITRPCISTAQQLHGKELSYNNILDLDSAVNLVREFTQPACVVVKHNNPCGAATASSLADAFRHAWTATRSRRSAGSSPSTRPSMPTPRRRSPTRGRSGSSSASSPRTTTRRRSTPSSSGRRTCGWLKTGRLEGGPQGLDYRRVDGGLLVQTRDVGADDPESWKVVTKRQPTADEMAALRFAWFVCKHVKSNAIVLASGTRVVGVGAGQMSRVDSVQIAVRKAGDRVTGSVLASDAFFPFRDNVDAAAAAGVVAVVQPGGSVKDADSVAACDEHGLAMVFTGVRHFRH